jgi:hypothetical protein
MAKVTEMPTSSKVSTTPVLSGVVFSVRDVTGSLVWVVRRSGVSCVCRPTLELLRFESERELPDLELEPDCEPDPDFEPELDPVRVLLLMSAPACCCVLFVVGMG